LFCLVLGIPPLYSRPFQSYRGGLTPSVGSRADWGVGLTNSQCTLTRRDRRLWIGPFPIDWDLRFDYSPRGSDRRVLTFSLAIVWFLAVHPPIVNPCNNPHLPALRFSAFTEGGPLPSSVTQRPPSAILPPLSSANYLPLFPPPSSLFVGDFGLFVSPPNVTKSRTSPARVIEFISPVLCSVTVTPEFISLCPIFPHV